MESLKEKVVIVTGSSAGIGESTAILFSKFGCKLVITGRDENNLQRVAKLCEDASPNKYKPLSVIGDIGNASIREELIRKTIETYQKLDILVNNAGFGILEDFLSEDFPDAFEEVFNVNVRAPLMLTRIALPHLINTKGCVVNVSSIASYRLVIENNLAYSMSKSALDSMTRILANEFGPKGVRVVSVNPGWVKTTILKRVGIPESMYDVLTKDYPLKRAGNPEEIANVICFVASSGASFITGTSILVDGGHSTA